MKHKSNIIASGILAIGIVLFTSRTAKTELVMMYNEYVDSGFQHLTVYVDDETINLNYPLVTWEEENIFEDYSEGSIGYLRYWMSGNCETSEMQILKTTLHSPDGKEVFIQRDFGDDAPVLYIESDSNAGHTMQYVCSDLE